jgi:hypothetical protein
MRWALALMGLTVAGCNVTRTMPLADADSYFDGKTVVTKDGYPLSLDDGGILRPVARKGLCLEEVGEDVIAVGDRDVPLLILEAAPGSDCAKPRGVSDPLRASMGDDTLTIVGRKRAIRAPTKAVYGISVHAPKNGEDAPRGRTYKTEPRSTALAIAGGAFVLAGIGGAIAAGVEWSAAEDGDYRTQHLYTGLFVFSLGAGLGAGTTMMVIGGTKVRSPVEASEVKLELGVGNAAANVSF